MAKGIVFNIQKCSLHDGPGIRTLVFLKGCPLRCAWCSNPESQRPEPEIASFPGRCIGCRACWRACPERAIDPDGPGLPIDPGRCSNCLACAGPCYAGSKQVIGRELDTAEVMAEVLKDRAFYRRSGGGVTFSGGEPLMQPAFLLDLLEACRRHGVPAALETSAHGGFDTLREAAGHLDTLYVDIKHMDPRRHQELTGAPNDLLLDNIRGLDGLGRPFTVRVPVVPGCNDRPPELAAVARFCLGLGSLAALELLPYHRLGEHKYPGLGRRTPLAGLDPPDGARMAGIRDTLAGILAPRRIPVRIVHA